MGQCYSCDRQDPNDLSMSTKPGQTKVPKGASRSSATKPPLNSNRAAKNGRERRGSGDSRAALSDIHNKAEEKQQSRDKAVGGKNRFGFGFMPGNNNKKDVSRKVIDLASSESLLSTDATNSPPARAGKATPLTLSDIDSDYDIAGRRPLSFSYTPAAGEHWKMIDDTSTSDSLSARSKSLHQLRSSEQLDKASSKSISTITNSIHGGERRANGVPRKLSFNNHQSSDNFTGTDSDKCDNWVRAGSVEEDVIEANKVNNNNCAPHAKHLSNQNTSLSSRAKSWFNRRRLKSDQSKSSKSVSEDAQAKLLEDRLDGTNGNKVDNIVYSSQSDATDSSHLLKKQPKATKSPKELTNKDHVSPNFANKTYNISSPVQQPPPLATLEAGDNSSVGSLHSDDLMLDTEDIYLDDDQLIGEGSIDQLPLDQSAQDDHIGVILRRAEERRHAWRDGRTNSAGANPADTSVQRSSIPEEAPIKELSNLMDSSAPRRSAKLRKATRPSSFPGPARHYTAPHYQSDSTPDTPQTPQDYVSSNGFPSGGRRSKSLRPPRQRTSSTNDDDIVRIEGPTYRQLMQDITDYKTMLLKLRRLIQDDEIGTPFGGAHKSHPTSPSSPTKETTPFLAEEKKTDDTKDINVIIQENQELHQKVATMQNTIALLQQQMTKYECGYTAKDGTKFANAAVQTEKRLVTKSSFGIKPPSHKTQFNGAPSTATTTSTTTSTITAARNVPSVTCSTAIQTGSSSTNAAVGAKANKNTNKAGVTGILKKPSTGRQRSQLPGSVTLASKASGGSSGAGSDASKANTGTTQARVSNKPKSGAALPPSTSSVATSAGAKSSSSNFSTTTTSIATSAATHANKGNLSYAGGAHMYKATASSLANKSHVSSSSANMSNANTAVANKQHAATKVATTTTVAATTTVATHSVGGGYGFGAASQRSTTPTTTTLSTRFGGRSLLPSAPRARGPLAAVHTPPRGKAPPRSMLHSPRARGPLAAVHHRDKMSNLGFSGALNVPDRAKANPSAKSETDQTASLGASEADCSYQPVINGAHRSSRSPTRSDLQQPQRSNSLPSSSRAKLTLDSDQSSMIPTRIAKDWSQSHEQLDQVTSPLSSSPRTGCASHRRRDQPVVVMQSGVVLSCHLTSNINIGSSLSAKPRHGSSGRRSGDTCDYSITSPRGRLTKQSAVVSLDQPDGNAGCTIDIAGSGSGSNESSDKENYQHQP